MIYIGIDPAGGGKKHALCMISDAGNNYRPIWLNRADGLKTIIGIIPSTVVSIEAGHIGPNQKSAMALQLERGRLIEAAKQSGAKAIHLIHVLTWRSFMLPKEQFPDRTKAAMKKAAIEVAHELSGEKLQEDMAEAYCIAYYTRESYNLGVELENVR